MTQEGNHMEELLLDALKIEESSVRPYQEKLLPHEWKKIDKLSQRLDETISTKLKLYIKDSTPVDSDEYESDDGENPRADFCIAVTPLTTVDEVKDIVHKRWKDLELIETTETSGITMVLNGKTMLNGTQLKDYRLVSKRGRWPTPYCGCAWIVPNHLEPNHKKDWGSVSDLYTRYDPTLLFAEWEI